MRSLLKKAISEKNISYSAHMRWLRKNHPDRVQEFMKIFKEAFDVAQNEKLDSAEHLALIQAIKSMDVT